MFADFVSFLERCPFQVHFQSRQGPVCFLLPCCYFSASKSDIHLLYTFVRAAAISLFVMFVIVEWRNYGVILLNGFCALVCCFVFVGLMAITGPALPFYI